MENGFVFHSGFTNCDDEICVKVNALLTPDESKYHVPTYNFAVYSKAGNEQVGAISFKVGSNDGIYFGGNIGYEIYPQFRGRHYAYKACKLLFPLIKMHGWEKVIITCDPDNLPSARTCELLGAKKLEVVTAKVGSIADTLGMATKVRYELTLT